MKRVRLVAAAGLLLAAALAAGCQRGPLLLPVRGKILYHDRPLVPGSIYFNPEQPRAGDEGPGQLMASGLLHEDGSFTLRTYPHGDGAMAGAYKVTLSLGAGCPPDLAAYNVTNTTPLRIEVPPGGLNDLVIRLPLK